MLEKDTLIKVTNRDNGSVGYTIPDLNNLHRSFQSGETKEITMEELRKLSYITGGRYILENCLKIENKEAVAEILGDVEPEYNYSAKEVEEILLTGSLDNLEDTLNFGPDGVKELVKDLAVKLEIPDIRKRDMIFEKTGLNVTTAININHESQTEDNEEGKIQRKTTPITVSTDEAPVQRKTQPVTTGKYNKIVLKEN